MSIQTINNNLNYLIDPTFTKVNRSFVLSSENEDNWTSFSKYYHQKLKWKILMYLLMEKVLFDTPIKYREEEYKKIIEMGKNND